MNKTIRLTLMLCLVLSSMTTTYAQFSKRAYLEKFQIKGKQAIAFKSSIIKGNDGYIYICGATLNTNGDYDMILTKYTAQNQEVWTRTYGGIANGNDFATDLVQDTDGNIVITGTEQMSPTNYDAVTIKYSADGVGIWARQYDGAANLLDGGVSIKTDASGNLYMCGATSTLSTQMDFLVVKYNTYGTQQWVTTWDNVNLPDVAARLEVRGSTVSIIGASGLTANKWQMANLKLNATNGAISGYRLTGGDAQDIDKVADLAIDMNDNTYILVLS